MSPQLLCPSHVPMPRLSIVPGTGWLPAEIVRVPFKKTRLARSTNKSRFQHDYIYIYMHMYMYMYMHMYMYMYTLYIYICICICISVCEFVWYIYIYVYLCACVCVWNIWTDVKLLLFFSFAGGGSRVQSLPPTKTLWFPWWYMAWSAMRTCHFPIFFVDGIRPSLQPDTWFFAARLSQSDDYFYFGYVDRYLYTSVHFRMLSSGWVTSLWSLFSFSYFYPGNSDDHFEEDSLGSRSCLVVHVRDSVPNWPDDGSFLV